MLKIICLSGMIRGVAALQLALKEGYPRYKADAALQLPLKESDSWYSGPRSLCCEEIAVTLVFHQCQSVLICS